MAIRNLFNGLGYKREKLGLDEELGLRIFFKMEKHEHL